MKNIIVIGLLILPLASHASLFKNSDCVEQFLKKDSTSTNSIVCWKGKQSVNIAFANGVIKEGDPLLSCIEDKNLISEFGKVSYGFVHFNSRNKTTAAFGLAADDGSTQVNSDRYQLEYAEILSVHHFEASTPLSSPYDVIDAKFSAVARKIKLNVTRFNSGSIQQEGSEKVNFDGCDTALPVK